MEGSTISGKGAAQTSPASFVSAPSAVAVWERPPLHRMIREAWRDRGLVPRLGMRTLVSVAGGTKLGWIWLILGPAIPILGMGLLFGGILRVPTSGDVPYLPFLLAGMSGWMLLSRTILWTTRSFERIRKVLRRFHVPPLVIPFSGVMMGSISFIVILSIFVVVLVVYWVSDGELYLKLGPQLLVGLAGIALAVVMACAMGLWLSVLNAWARDVRLTLRYVLGLWLYVTPVLYPPEALPSGLAFLATVNPAAAIVEMIKYGLLDVGHVEPNALAVSLGFTAVVLAGGLIFYRHFFYVLQSRVMKGRDDQEDDEL